MQLLQVSSPFDGTQLCLTEDPNLFFPEDYLSKTKVAKAKAICGDCWVKDECLQFALRTKEKEGIWGGKTPSERRKLRRKERALARSSG